MGGTAGGAQVEQVSVLVVDDQEAFRSAMAGVVEATDGFVLVGSAASGEEALTLAGALRPQLVLMDVHLPGIDGVEAARRLCAAGDPPVVVLLSTYEEDEVELDGCGAAAYVPKRLFGPDRLVTCWSQASG
jgi:DNA-binding NarL/FixJ family response regulator